LGRLTQSSSILYRAISGLAAGFDGSFPSLPFTALLLQLVYGDTIFQLINRDHSRDLLAFSGSVDPSLPSIGR
jgi:hypothetical protein